MPRKRRTRAGPREKAERAAARRRENHARQVGALLDQLECPPSDQHSTEAAIKRRLRQMIALHGAPAHDHLRRRVWICLLDVHVQPNLPQTLESAADSTKHIESGALQQGVCPEPEPELAKGSEKIDDQMWLDVNRSMHHYVPRLYTRNSTLSNCRAALFRMMKRVLINLHVPNGSVPHYYQGFHDVAAVFLLTCGEEFGTRMLERVAANHLAFALTKDMEATKEVLQLLPHLLRQKTPDAAAIIAGAGIDAPVRNKSMPFLLVSVQHVSQVITQMQC